MKKCLFLASALCCAAFGAAAQESLTIRFTGANQNDGSHVRLTTVLVKNLDRGWQQTVVYPDTTLVLTPGGATGVGAPQQATGLALFPNVGGAMRLELASDLAGQAQVEVYDLGGRLAAATTADVQSGVNAFELRLGQAAPYIARVTVAGQSHSAKFVNTAPAGADHIASLGAAADGGLCRSGKCLSENEFELGDQMQYTGFAVVGGVTQISPAITQAQTASEDIALQFDLPVPGDYYFSAGPNIRLEIAPGNLQYKASTGTWRFAPQQYAHVGNDNANISATYDGWIDLFGWGTSGFDCGNTYFRPTDAAYDAADPSIDEGYGPVLNNSFEGEFANCDWGRYNQIENPRTGNVDPAGTWYTPTLAEWKYVLTQRPAAATKRGAATINGIRGFILLPDNWVAPAGINFTAGGALGWATNSFSTSQWQLMEQFGAAFFPAAGVRRGTEVGYVQSDGLYWSSTSYTMEKAYDWAFFFLIMDGTIYLMEEYVYERSTGQAVRLARKVEE